MTGTLTAWLTPPKMVDGGQSSLGTQSVSPHSYSSKLGSFLHGPGEESEELWTTVTYLRGRARIGRFQFFSSVAGLGS